ncbi:MAG: branched-chain amino acid transport system ATP-binding protein [Actinomycetota bacterium]|nr:branched-chain amino acid transport system ATP-binding protein [Actinomycetota bacterium]
MTTRTMGNGQPASPGVPADRAAGPHGGNGPAPGTGREILARVDGVTLAFGGLTALDGVTFTVHEGEILGLIGPNGAGKTTFFNVLTGVHRPDEGRILLDGRPVTGLRKHMITRRGIARTFQNIRLFSGMTALENVMVGVDSRHRTSVPGALLRLPRHRHEEERARKNARALLEFVGIGRHSDQLARNLPYGEQRRLEIARALATEPRLLCLDEPAAGSTPSEKDQLLELIRATRDRGVTVLLIEHDMRLVMRVTDRIVVLDHGRVIADGAPEEIREDPQVVAAYLGVPTDAA